MKRFLIGLAIAVATLPLAAHSHAGHDHSDVSISIDSEDGNITECNQIKVTFAGEPAVRAEENIPAANLQRLRVNAKERGGVRVAGWDQSGWSIKACKAAANASALSDVHVSLRGDELTATNDGDESMVYFLIQAPKNAVLDVE